ncbi:amidohydrolase [Pseudoflavonifractor capillosus]|uniref:amidohydrolase n=1 Tax=Pseudoflavonifractor capillosus TaxID=106588 RepID=UPI001956B681|nr:amidohydrolase [Pseudoflavonifractor capillosus]MBM6681642.1 amidohydrolase [Pseudoflavonifractor capillosus]
MIDHQELIHSIEGKQSAYIAAASQIWDYAETAFQEYRSAQTLEELLEQAGFQVRRNVAGMETAFVAEAGSGKPVIGFLGEYDALPGLSQQADVAVHTPIVEGGPGHGCCHHILGTGALAAAVALKEYMERHSLPGTVRYYGCPAEEGGAGKIYLAKAGLFDDADCAITWHPCDDNNIWSMNFMAIQNLRIRFYGVAAHSASQGHLGRNALEATELTGVGSNYLRGHVERDVCINYAVTNAGGPAPNVIQDYAEMVYNIRAYTHKKAVAAAQWVEEIAKGAAMMSRTRVEVLYEGGLSELIPNRTLERIAYEKFLQVGPTPYTQEDLDFCAKIHETFPAGSEESTFNNLSYLYGKTAQELIPQIRGKVINDVIYPYTEIPHAKYGSTDVCDVSWFTPTMQVTTACYAKDTPGHSWQQVAQGKRSLCFNGMLTAAKIMALTGAELATSPDKVRAMRDEFQAAMAGRTYECPLPSDMRPGSAEF